MWQGMQQHVGKLHDKKVTHAACRPQPYTVLMQYSAMQAFKTGQADKRPIFLHLLIYDEHEMQIAWQ